MVSSRKPFRLSFLSCPINHIESCIVIVNRMVIDQVGKKDKPFPHVLILRADARSLLFHRRTRAIQA